MYGISIGDIAGSSYEFSGNAEDGFKLFDKSRKHQFTDDTVLTAAVCKALLMTKNLADPKELSSNVRRYLQRFAVDFPFAGYGGWFSSWVERYDYQPYYSYGNGAAMRISPVAWVGKSEEEVCLLSDICTGVTHSHPEGLKGAKAIALAVFLARSKKRENKTDKEVKDVIRKCIQDRFYSLDSSLADIRHTHEWSSSCQVTVPQAIVAFLESDSFESAIRNAVLIGGDSDTLGAMTGAIAEAYYGVPSELKNAAISSSNLDRRLMDVFDEFEEKYQHPSCCGNMIIYRGQHET